MSVQQLLHTAFKSVNHHVHACRNCIKRKLTKSPFTPKFALSRARYLSLPLAKRGKRDAARVLFENAAQDKSTVAEEDEFWSLGGKREKAVTYTRPH